MKHSIKILAASLAAAFGLSAAPAIADTGMEPHHVTHVRCKGELAAGSYIIKPAPGQEALSADSFDGTPAEGLVKRIEPLSGGLRLLVPYDITADCEEIMQKVKDTGLVEYIQPNWVMQIHNGAGSKPQP